MRHPTKCDLDNRIADSKAEPMFIVMPNGRDQKDDDRPIENVFHYALTFAVLERELLDDVIPTIESRYAVLKSRDQRALAELSMSGGQSLNFGLGHMDTFAWVRAISY